MVTNTFTPHVGGVARSVTTFTQEFRRLGHQVLVIAPTFPGQPADEDGVVRVPALQKFNGSDFSVVLAPSRKLTGLFDEFAPDIVHAHHPFLLGSTAMRLARRRQVPLIFTNHTFFERYTHYVSSDSAALKRFVVRLTTNYANLSSEVFAPSEGVAEILRQRQVRAPIRVVPSGVSTTDFLAGDGDGFRAALGIPAGAPLIGTVGRLAEEKNLAFLTKALSVHLAAHPSAFALIVGDGPMRESMQAGFDCTGVGKRVRFTGTLESQRLIDAYAAMDVFAFASLSETQGLVLAEAMAAGVPVVALAATGVSDVLRDGENGRAIANASEAAFALALAELAHASPQKRQAIRAACLRTGTSFAIERVAEAALDAYRAQAAKPAEARNRLDDAWRRSVNRIRTEWDLVSATMGAASVALNGSREPQRLDSIVRSGHSGLN
jgi:glycosyltransferase involved in cell wall biosynthesis